MSEAAPAQSTPRSLSDVLVAMDVVDTLRHRDQIFLKELDTVGREEDLVARLREIYAAQGMDVSEATIREGVRAMADRRYEHVPARPGPLRRLAIIYITRARWWKPVAGGAAALAVLGGGYQLGVAMPRAAAERVLASELNVTLPAALEAAHGAAVAAAATDAGRARADALRQSGLAALQRGEAAGARQAIDTLGALRREIEARYLVRVVNDPDAFSGVFREHDDLPGRQSFYLIVEAVDPTGTVLEVTVTDEETNQVARVRRWGQRVSRTVFEGVMADKRDDMIIQDAIIGEKLPGALEPAYSVSTPGGALTEW